MKNGTFIIALFIAFLTLISCDEKKPEVYVEGSEIMTTSLSAFKEKLKERRYRYSHSDNRGIVHMVKKQYPYLAELEYDECIYENVEVVNYAVYVSDSVIKPKTAVEEDSWKKKKGYTKIITGCISGFNKEVGEYRYSKADNIKAEWREDDHGFSLYISTDGKETKIISSK